MPLTEEHTPVVEWFRRERGIEPETLDAFGVFVRDDGVVIYPYPNGVKERKGLPHGEREFYSPRGVALGLFQDKGAVGTPVMFLVEGETDTMRLFQELNGEYTVLGVPGNESWSKEYADNFSNAEYVYVILDNDRDYNVAARTDNCWRQIRLSVGRKAHRIILPDDVKDVCEFFERYSIETLRMLVEKDMTKAPSRYHALDLTKDPEPYDWLVEDLLCRGDTALVVGEPGVGKSWLSMSLAVAVVEGHSAWMGRPLTTAGRVLYVDEENPEDLVFHRLRALGLGQGARNLRYLHRQGIRLDKYADVLLDEALLWEPTLIVLDSLTRLHTQDENNAGMVAALFNDGINPLARETGATVVVLHHVNKSDSSSSFARSRGSGDITASVDTGLDIRKVRSGGHINVVHFKSRRRMANEVISAKIADVEDGVRIQVITPEEAPF